MNTAIKIFLVALTIHCSSLAGAVEYTFEKVYSGPAQPGVAINDNGLVALISGTDSLFLTDGENLTEVAGPTGLASLHGPYGYDYYQALSLNNNGFVTFQGRTWANKYGLFASDGTTIKTIAADTSNGGSFETLSTFAASINDDGLVAFGAKPNGGNYRIYVGDGDSSSEINEHYGSVPSINNEGTVAYRNDTSYIIEIQKGTQLYSLPDIIAAHLPDINDLGQTAFFGAADGKQYVVVWDGISTPTYIDGVLYSVLSGGFTYDGGSPDCAINNQGLVAFGASLPLEEGSDFERNVGIFTGADPVSDKVIQTGDLLDDEAVKNVLFSRNGLNNLGQIAFWAELSNGTKGVWVATPVPEPSAIVLLGIGTMSLLAPIWRRNRSRK